MDESDIWAIAEFELSQLKGDHNSFNQNNISEDSNIILTAEWNNYKDDCGNYSKSTQRGDVYSNDNPYSHGGTIVNMNDKFIHKLSVQQCFNHKQKTYWEIGNIIQSVCDSLNLNENIVALSKHFWHKYMESGKLTRASVRKGLIAACIYHSCVHNKTPIEREEIIKLFSCNSKTLSKGEKVLFEILELDNNNELYTGIKVEDSNSFYRYCSQLNLDPRIANICQKKYEKYKIQLQAVTPKSVVGGIIAYVVKYDLKLKIPTKSIISVTTDVCTPTINKVISIILENS